MRFSKPDFLAMRWSILACCASALASAAILYSSSKYAENALKDRRDAQSLLVDARKRLAAAHEDQKNMRSYDAEYGVLSERKVIGDDRRLDWMEGMEKIRLQNLVTDFRYNIAPQKIYAPQPPVDSGNFDIRYSEMKLQFDLLHEAQLLHFFDALHTDIKGWYQLEGCTLQRNAATPGSGGNGAPQLKAECGGGWVTLKNRSAPQ
ncbi:MAG: hypothetical protein EPN14_02980 [Gallionella sp.]|nr:MAG: hypothetical protein EPN14_02980 [Gallionella sp.]